MISKEEFSRVIKNQDHLYKACIANGYYLCSQKSSFISSKLLKEVYMGTTHCPLISDIK